MRINNIKNKDKRILICSLNDSMGGAEQVLKMIAKYYLQENYYVDVFFLTKSKGSLWQDLEGNIRLYYTDASKERKGILTMYNNLRMSKYVYDYCYTSHIYMNAFIGILKRCKLVKIESFVGRDSRSYFLVEKGIKRLMYSLLINIGYSSLDLLISQTDEMRLQFIINKPNLSKRIKLITIPNPIVIDPLKQLSESLIFGDSYDKTIIAAGRLIKIKGFDILIKAFHRLDLENYRLVILGEGVERNNLEKLVLELNLQDKVKMIGFVDNVYPYFKKAHVCVISSLKEGFPNVLLQMMSQNTKVVSTKCAGSIEDIKGVFTCKSDDIEELALTIKNCLSSDTSANTDLFYDELNKRSIYSFIGTIKKQTNNV